MRGLTAITALALVLGVPAWAQHGASHAGGPGGGHAGGFGGGYGGAFVSHGGFGVGGGRFTGSHVVDGHSFIGMRGPRGPIISGGFTHPPFSHTSLAHRHLHRFHNSCFGLGCWTFGAPWWYTGIDSWWWDSRSSYDEDYEREQALAAEMNARNLEEQQMLRQEQAERDQDAYARPARREQEKPEPDPPAIPPATVLVFRDHHRQEVQNYAIIGQTLWAIAPQHQRISLLDLDLGATTEANDDRGVTFRVPVANEAP